MDGDGQNKKRRKPVSSKTALAGSTLIGLLFGIFDLVSNSFGVVGAGAPKTWAGMLMLSMIVASSLYGLFELRENFRLLYRPSILRLILAYLATAGFIASLLGAVYAVLAGLWTGSAWYLLATLTMSALMAFFGSWRGYLTSRVLPIPPEIKLAWARMEESRIAALKKNEQEYIAALKEDPDFAKLERMPTRWKIQMGYY
jgi:hypothetical protein